MRREDVVPTVRAILHTIAPEVDLAAIRTDADLREELDIDSMDFLRFVVQLHERLGVDVPEADYPSIRTLDNCVAYLVAHASERTKAPSGGA